MYGNKVTLQWDLDTCSKNRVQRIAYTLKANGIGSPKTQEGNALSVIVDINSVTTRYDWSIMQECWNPKFSLGGWIGGIVDGIFNGGSSPKPLPALGQTSNSNWSRDSACYALHKSGSQRQCSRSFIFCARPPTSSKFPEIFSSFPFFFLLLFRAII